MLKIRKEIDLSVFREQYGFKWRKSDGQDYLIYCDDELNELIVYPFADNLVQMLMRVQKKVSNSYMDISQTGVCAKLQRLIRDNKIYIQIKEDK